MKLVKSVTSASVSHSTFLACAALISLPYENASVNFLTISAVVWAYYSRCAQWRHHVNPDIQRGRQQQIVDKVADEAYKGGYDCWVVFDADEAMVAQGCRT